MAEPINYSANMMNEIISEPSTSVTNTVWSQITPASMPWGSSCVNFPQVVRFTGSKCYSSFPFGSSIDKALLDNEITTKRWIYKRKNYFENELIPPSKKHITEDHMASQLESMHISKMYTSHSSQEEPNFSDANRMPELIDESSNDRNIGICKSTYHMPSLVICDELRHLQTPNILPPSLVAKLESPSKALVLWKPPAPVSQCCSFDPGFHSDKQLQDFSNNNNNNNNSHEDLEHESDNIHLVNDLSSGIERDLTPCSMISGSASSFLSSSGGIEDMSVDI